MKDKDSIICPKVQELIAIGTSVGVHCEPCLQYHIQKAKAEGVSENEILEAINIGKQVERGAIANMQKKVDQLFETKSNKEEVTKMDKREKIQTPQASCCSSVEEKEETSSCCVPLDTHEETVSRTKEEGEPKPVYRGWVTAEMKYGMYLPAIQSSSLRDSSGSLKYPLPGPIGVTEVVQEARIEEGSKVLEVAASVGHIAMLAAKIVGPKGEVALAQLDWTLVESAEAYIAKYGQDSVRVVKASAERIPYPEDYFDAVISDRAVCCLYSKLENQQRLMNEIAKVTKPGGKVVLIEAIPKDTPPPEGKRIPGCLYTATFTKEPEKVVGMFRKAGLESISIKRIPNSKMATKEMCDALDVPIGDEYLEFVILSATKKKVPKVQEEKEIQPSTSCCGPVDTKEQTSPCCSPLDDE